MNSPSEIVKVNGAAEPAPQSDAFLSVIAAAAQNPTFDVATMKELLAARREELKFQAEVEFNAAMSRLQPKLPVIDRKGRIVVPAKEGRSGHNTPYARLEDIDKICRPLLAEEGFSVSYDSETLPGSFEIVWICIVRHRAGHVERFKAAPLPPDKTGSKNEVQARGSTNSYGKRYSFCNAFNIVTKGEDDDGNASGYISEAQEMQVRDLLEACNITPDSTHMRSFLSFAGANRVAHIQSSRFNEIIDRLKTKYAKMQEGA